MLIGGWQVEETLSTLSYATRAKHIANRPTVQYDPREAQIAMLRREIELLRQENSLLKEQLRAGALPGDGLALQYITCFSIRVKVMIMPGIITLATQCNSAAELRVGLASSICGSAE